MLIRMSEFGSSLCTRSSGRKVYDLISMQIKKNDCQIVFDFDDVTSVTNSFADEVFGRLVFDIGLDALKEKTSFINIKVFPARVIRIAIDNRDSKKCISA